MRAGFKHGSVLFLLGIILFPVTSSMAAKAVVVNTNDEGAGSLRYALETCGFAGKDTVVFQIQTTDAGYNPATRVWTIKPSAGYTVPKETVVDGTISIAIGGGKNILRPGIEVDGTVLGSKGVTGLTLEANVVLRGLVVNNFQYAIWVASANVTVERCFVGTDPTGQTAKSNGTNGILLIHSATGAVIQGNLVSGNQSYGIRISGASATGNVVRNNRIGTDSSGTSALPNGYGGIAVHAGAHDNIIENNLVSGNNGIGIHLYDAGTNGNRIRQNRVGTGVEGNKPLPNASFGVALFNGACNNTVGPDNRIAFNVMDGVLVDGSNSFTGTVGNTIAGNSITANGRKGILNYRGGNGETARPSIASATAFQIAGTAAPQSAVDLYVDADEEGAFLVGTTVADATGHFSLSMVNPLPELPNVTATATNAAGSTSEFSAPFVKTGVEEETLSGLCGFSLCQNHPNPFNGSTKIVYSIPKAGRVRLAVYDMRGRKVSVLVDGVKSAGIHSSWFESAGLPSGIYVYRIRAGGDALSRKLILTP